MNWSASYCDLLESCQAPHLSDRQRKMNVCHLFKIIAMAMAYQTVRWPRLCTEHSTTAAAAVANPVQIRTLFAQTS